MGVLRARTRSVVRDSRGQLYALAFVGAVLLVAVQPATAQLPERVGVYHWGGSRHIPVDVGVKMIADLGSNVARIVLSSRYHSDYGAGTDCLSGFSLPAIVQEPAMQRALDDLRIHTFILTAYDGASFGDCSTLHFLNPRFYNAQNSAAIQAEYRDLVLYLVHRYSGSGRRFVISNWESDNAVYCQSAVNYATDSSFRGSCDANYAALYDGNAGPAESMDGLRLWLILRQQGIAEGLRLAQEGGWSGVDVVQAPEMNIVRTLEAHGFPSVFRAVLSGLGLGWVSYSSYESINADSPERTLSEDIRTIRGVTAARHIIIGEAGIPRSLPDAAARLQSAINTALAQRVEHFIVWNLNDQGNDFDFGLFDQTGAITPTGRMMQTMFQPPIPPVRAGSRPKKTAH
jgi:hypothetical protein